MKKQSGFTLIEMMVTLIIAGTLYAIAGPSLKDVVSEKQSVATTNELLAALHIARSEAIKLNKRVTICESSNGTSCSSTGKWEKGWIVFADALGAASVSTGSACSNVASDCLLRVHDEIDDDKVTIRGLDQGSNTIHSLTFTSRGLPKDTAGNGQSGVFKVCNKDIGGNKFSRAVIVSFSGRVRVSEATTVTSTSSGGNTTAISCP
ncbi:MAG TPA: prepilin-type N-terminal cleavage/methylation domain-containing protein [Gammaproteobacteria bacterium]|nr:prepilin-type N-terminal cleavage/methylation domain-containing protein [Gammaproteobacteria bacterium]